MGASRKTVIDAGARDSGLAGEEGTEVQCPALSARKRTIVRNRTAAAPLLCAGIIGFRTLRLTGLGERPDGWRGARLGLYGCGAAGHVVIQLGRARGAEVFVSTRDRERHQALAAELGAAWVGGAKDAPPVQLDAAIILAPAGELVPPALRGIHMSPVPSLDYDLLYGASPSARAPRAIRWRQCPRRTPAGAAASAQESAYPPTSHTMSR